jgi:Tfp pilus assembly protein PilX
MNEYEQAVKRFNAAVRDHAIALAEAEAMVAAADDEWEAAQANLRQYETSPGIALPQYREGATA